MTEINFSKIRGDSNTGQRGCFEEFVCQIARPGQPNAENCEFRRVEVVPEARLNASVD